MEIHHLTKAAIEEIFIQMGLEYSDRHDFWFFPAGIKSTYQFSIRSLIDGNDHSKKEIQIKISGPVVADQWYYPDQAIKRIQKIIYEIFEYHAEERDKRPVYSDGINLLSQ